MVLANFTVFLNLSNERKKGFLLRKNSSITAVITSQT